MASRIKKFFLVEEDQLPEQLSGGGGGKKKTTAQIAAAQQAAQIRLDPLVDPLKKEIYRLDQVVREVMDKDYESLPLKLLDYFRNMSQLIKYRDEYIARE